MVSVGRSGTLRPDCRWRRQTESLTGVQQAVRSATVSDWRWHGSMFLDPPLVAATPAGSSRWWSSTCFATSLYVGCDIPTSLRARRRRNTSATWWCRPTTDTWSPLCRELLMTSLFSLSSTCPQPTARPRRCPSTLLPRSSNNWITWLVAIV